MTCAIMKTSSSLHIKWRVLTQAALHNILKRILLERTLDVQLENTVFTAIQC